MAGLGPANVSRGAHGQADYTTTRFAKQGDYGSVLPAAPTNTVWTMGSQAEVGFSIRANHGGGYSYRLCPASSPLTEACMMAHPLQWATGYHTLEWKDGHRQRINATEVGDPYVLPKGSTWRMNPLPHSTQTHPAQFPPPCGNKTRTEESCCSWPWPSVDGSCTKPSDRKHCCFGRDPFDVLILDLLHVPGDLPAGDYVLGHRWDCEVSAQVWQQCADITIVAPVAPVAPATLQPAAVAPPPPPPPPPTPACASWCAGHAGSWQQKCTYTACSLCPQCTHPPAPAPTPAVPCLNASNPHFDCPAPCFCSTAINATLITPILNITFSKKYNLQLDLYLPKDDTTTRLRPTMVAVHGGGFSGGNRQSEGTWCQRLAARGYVCATVDYRLHAGISPGQDPLAFLGIILNATEDTRAAIRWLRANAAKYKIDTTRVGAIGASAGAIITAFLVTVPGEGDGGNPGVDSSVQAGVSFSGALLATEYLQVKHLQPAFLDMHGCDDHVVPYGFGTRPPLSYAYNGVSTHQEMLRRGANSSLISFAGRGHIGEAGGMSAAVNAHADEVWAFLAIHLNLSTAVCPPSERH